MKRALDSLFVQQPYASLIIFGKKRWEFRSYDAKKRGEIGIISSHHNTIQSNDNTLNKAVQTFPKGVLLGTAELVNSFFITNRVLKKFIRDVVTIRIHGNEITTIDSPIGEPLIDVVKASENQNWNSWVWEFENIHPFEDLISVVRSSQSVWQKVEF